MSKQKSSILSMSVCALAVLLVVACQPASQAVEEKVPVTDGKARLAMFEKHLAMEKKLRI